MASSSTLKWVLVGEDRTGPAFRGAASGMDTLATKAKSVGKSLSMYVTAPLAAVGVAGVKTAADFGVTMASLQVNANASGAEMEKMRGKAIQLGADTVFSAGDAAQAMLELSKAGQSTGEILGGTADAVVNLAATESIDLARASAIVANTMNQFALSAEDAGTVVDLLAAGAVASTASVESLSEGLTYVGGTARALRMPLSDTVTGLAMMTKGGMESTVAGTSLNNMLLRLNPASDKAKAAIEKLGLEFFDARGEMKPMPAIVDELDTAFAGMSRERKIGFLQTIFGKQGMRAATVLMEQGVGGWNQLEAATTRGGVAQELASARMAGMAGAIEQVKGSAETAALTIGESLAPKVIGLSQTITKAVNWFTNLSAGTKNLVVNLGLAAAAIGPLTWGFGKAIDTVRALKVGVETAHRAFQVGHAILRVYGSGVAQTAASVAASTVAHVKHGAVVAGQFLASMGRAAAGWAAQAAGTVAATVALVAHKAASVAVAAGAKALAAAQWLVNAAMTANPIGLVVAALVGLGVGLKMAWDKSQTFREVVVSVFAGVGKAVLTMAEVWLRGYQWMTDKFLAFVGVVISGAAKAFGWVPGVGPKLKEAANGFDAFRAGVNSKFDAVIGKVGEWKSTLDRMPRKVQLEGDIRDLTAKIDSAKRQLNDPNLTKDRRAALKGEIGDLQFKLRQARADLDSNATLRTRTTRVTADTRGVTSGAASARRTLDSSSLMRTRTVRVRSDVTNVAYGASRARSYIAGIPSYKTVRVGVTFGVSGTPSVRLPSGKLVPLAEGGIVTRPTMALIGEAGPEAVVPLGKAAGFDFGGGSEVHVHFHSPVIGSDEDLARYITDAQRRYKRALGVPLGLG